MQIEVSGVKIELTKHQLQQIADQTKPKKDWRNVKSVLDAIEYLGDEDQDVLEYRLMYLRTYSILNTTNVRFSEQSINKKALELCIKAINDGWKVDLSIKDQKKWYNWYNIEDYRLVFFASDYCYDFAVFYGKVGFYYESEEKAKHGNTYFKQYLDKTI